MYRDDALIRQICDVLDQSQLSGSFSVSFDSVSVPVSMKQPSDHYVTIMTHHDQIDRFHSAVFVVSEDASSIAEVLESAFPRDGSCPFSFVCDRASANIDAEDGALAKIRKNRRKFFVEVHCALHIYKFVVSLLFC